MEDKVIVLRAAGGQAGVSGQRLWQREGLGTRVVRSHSLPFLLSGYTNLKVGEAEKNEFASVAPPQASLGRRILKKPT